MYVAIIMSRNGCWLDADLRVPSGPLWEVAYARHHADCLWPDFTARDFQRALGCRAPDERVAAD